MSEASSPQSVPAFWIENRSVVLREDYESLLEQLEAVQRENALLKDGSELWLKIERRNEIIREREEQLEALREAVREHVESAHGQYATDKHAKLRAALSNPAKERP